MNRKIHASTHLIGFIKELKMTKTAKTSRIKPSHNDPKKDPTESQNAGDNPDTANIILASLDRTGKITSINRYGCELLGETEKGLVGRDWFATFLSPDVAKIKRPQVAALFSGGIPSHEIESLEHPVTTKSGIERMIAWSFVPALDEKGTVTGTIAAGLDITERRKALDLLRENENYLRTIIDFVQTALILLDAETHEIVDVNPAAVKLIGIDRNKIVGSVCHKFICPAEKGKCPITDLHQTVDHSERVLLTPDGNRTPVIKSVIPVSIKGRRYLLESLIDITDLKKAEDVQRENEKYLRTIFDFVQTGLIMIDPETHEIVDANPAAVKLIGSDRNKIIGSVCHKFICPADRGKCPITDLKQTVDHSERVLLTADGKRMPIIKSVTSISSHGRNYLLESFFDITELKKAEEELQKKSAELTRSNLELRHFAYIASHDLQEPLRAISGFTELLAKRYRGKIDERADKYIGFITDGTSRMQQMIQDLLTYSRVETQGHEFERTDSNAVLDQALSNLQVLIEENKAVVTNDPLPEITADRDQITSLFQNLIANAVKFHKPGVIPKIHVSARQDENNWTFSVADNGIGIDQKYEDRLFKIFSRLHTKSEYPGTGIGLAMCKRIVDRHGGTIWLKSAPDAGTTFYFTIPVKPVEGQP
jgi:PAS domain S-box-containing protein